MDDGGTGSFTSAMHVSTYEVAVKACFAISTAASGAAVLVSLFVCMVFHQLHSRADKSTDKGETTGINIRHPTCYGNERFQSASG
jgi:mannose/fructose/N-acetylgalactosamine-specific phosphotransferase system component IIC